MTQQAWRDNVQLHIDAGTCYLCEKAVEPGSGVHGLSGAHWDCAEKLRTDTDKALDLRTTPVRRATGLYKRLVAKGGQFVHLVDTGTHNALCGYKQHNEARRMRQRSGWWKFTDEQLKGRRYCQGCLDNMDI